MRTFLRLRKFRLSEIRPDALVCSFIRIVSRMQQGVFLSLDFTWGEKNIFKGDTQRQVLELSVLFLTDNDKREQKTTYTAKPDLRDHSMATEL